MIEFALQVGQLAPNTSPPRNTTPLHVYAPVLLPGSGVAGIEIFVNWAARPRLPELYYPTRPSERHSETR